MRYKGKVVVIGGSTGSGESTLTANVISRIPGSERLVTATTRAMREGEKNGEDYFFLTESEFQKALNANEILIHAYMSDRNVHYGTYRPHLEQALERATVLFANVDIVGTRYFKSNYGATTIFTEPSSLAEVEERLKRRNPSMSSQELELRIKYAKREIETEGPEYDYHVVNANGKLNEAVDTVIEILKKEGYIGA